MKAKYIILSLIASLAVFTGCQPEEIKSLDQIQLSVSYVGIPVDGGQTVVTVTSSSNWAFVTEAPNDKGEMKATIPDWLTISPLSGSAGETKVTFSADAALDARSVALEITCDRVVQNINIVQGMSGGVSESTCAEVIAGPNGKQYRVTGTVTSIANTTYGNWYLEDETGSIYIYGTVDDSGNYNWASFNIEVGDEVTVEGPKTTYGTTVELVDVKVINVNKSLIKVVSIDPEDAVIPSAGGEISIELSNKGNGLYVEIPEEAREWLSISSLNGNSIVFKAVENAAGPRNTTLVFSTTDGSKDYTAQAEISQLGSSGSKDVPFTVTEAIEYVKALGGTTAGDFWVKGIVSKIVDGGEFGSFGNGTFWISEDGVYNDDLNKDFEAYRVLWLGNEKWAEGNAQIAEGVEVLICGKLTVYKDTAETQQNEAYVYSVNGVTTDAEGIGTLAAPFTAKGAIAAANSVGSTNSNFNAYIKGKVSSIVNNGQFGAEFGNGTFWISEDGTYNNDKSLDFEAYRVLWLGNKKWVEGDSLIAVGDDVILHGAVTLYNGTAETASGKAYVYSHNGKTE
ncbi:MAG: DNA-binding protein [Bacteroidales bacterium]|nr:DNA-binding protein [Bacteroidales bacterium]